MMLGILSVSFMALSTPRMNMIKENQSKFGHVRNLCENNLYSFIMYPTLKSEINSLHLYLSFSKVVFSELTYRLILEQDVGFSISLIKVNLFLGLYFMCMIHIKDTSSWNTLDTYTSII